MLLGLHSPILLPYLDASCDRYLPTSSNVLAPSKLPMVTSKSKFVDLFTMLGTDRLLRPPGGEGAMVL